MKTKDEIIADLRVAIPYFLNAIKDAQEEYPDSKIQMSITATHRDGSGKVGMSFDPVEFFNDLAALVDVELTEDDEINYKAEKLRGMLRANGIQTINGEPL